VIPGLTVVAFLVAVLAPPAGSEASRRMIALVTIKEVLHTTEQVRLPGLPGAYFPDIEAGEVIYFRAGDAPGPDTALAVSRQVALAGPSGAGTLSSEGFRIAGGPGEVPLRFARKAVLSLDPSTGSVTLSIEDRVFVLKPGAGALHIKDDRFEPSVRVDGHDVTRYGLFARNEGSFPADAFRFLDRSGI
jgi:hypothetical protein